MPMRLGTPMPTLDGAVAWLNIPAMPSLCANKVTLIHFWAVSCHICHETMSDVLNIIRKYERHGLQVVGVHMPRFESDTDVKWVKADMQEYGMFQPMAVDSEHLLAGKFDNEYVPAFFVFGTDGTLRFRAAGDKGFQKVEPKIREALGLPAAED